MIQDITDLNAKWGSKEFREEAAKTNDNDYALIPDGAKMPVRIDKAEIKEYDGSYYINMMYKIIDGAYKGRVVFQKFKVFDRDETGEKQRDKFARFYIACGIPLPREMPATNEGLYCFEQKEVGLCLGIFNGYQCVKWFAQLNEKFQIDDKKESDDWNQAPAPVNTNAVSVNAVDTKAIDPMDFDDIPF